VHRAAAASQYATCSAGRPAACCHPASTSSAAGSPVDASGDDPKNRRGNRRSCSQGSRVCPDSRRRARCRSRGGHQIVVVPRVPCALARACWQGGERPRRSRTVPVAATRQDPVKAVPVMAPAVLTWAKTA
jgi:hypothetical protein